MNWSGRKGLAKRLVLMVCGEALQSGFHFALNLALIHLLPAEAYGVFAIVMVIGGLGLTYIRSFTAMPASIWIAQSRNRAAANVHEVTFGSGAVVLSLVMAVGVWLLLRTWLDSGSSAGGVFVGLWAVRSHMRVAFFARGQARLVSLSDLAFTLGGAALAAAALASGRFGLAWVFSALAAANAIGIAVLAARAGRRMRISFNIHVRRRYARLVHPLGWSGFGVTLANLQGQGVVLLVAAVAGPAAYAPIAAMLVLFVPLRVAAAALANMMQPELSALLARGEDDAVWRQSWHWTLLMGGVGLAYGAGMMLLLPFLNSPTLQGSSPYLIGLFAWIVFTMTMLYVMPRIVLEAMTAFKTVAVITGIGAVVGLISIRLILFVATPAWSLGGGALSEMVVLVASWVALRNRIGPSGRSGERRGSPRLQQSPGMAEAAMR